MSLENSHLKVEPRSLCGQIEIPGSKSYANRLLVLAALNPKPVTIENVPRSTDVINMLEALKAIGLEIHQQNDEVVIYNSFPDCENEGTDPTAVHCADGGTTTRFLTALVALGKNTYHIEPSGGMRERPVKEMIEALKALGVHVEQASSAWLSVRGPIKALHPFQVNCSRSTQFASALALVLGNKLSLMKTLEMKNSRAYYEMTLELLKSSHHTHLKVPPDYSSASYPMALAAVTGNAVLTNCFAQDPFQADSVFIDILKKAGVNVAFQRDGLHIYKPQNLFPFEASCASCPDLAPTLAYLASFCEGESILYDLEVLEHKESDRFLEITKLLEVFQIEYQTIEKSTLKIKGIAKSNNQPKNVELTLPEDHRIIMSAYLFLRSLHGGKLDQAQHVKKSFSNFFQIMGEENAYSL